MKLSNFNEKNTYPTMFFGRYFIPNTIKPKVKFIRQPIEWLVVEVNLHENKALILSKFALDWEGFADCPIFGSKYATSWDKSYLRKWLNDQFYNECFSSEEKDNICTTHIANGEESASVTADKVFLLSAEDVNKYFATKESAIVCEPMLKMIASGGEEDPITIEYVPIMWWTRTIGKFDSDVVCVDATGKLCEMDSNLNEIGVRPAMWINL